MEHIDFSKMTLAEIDKFILEASKQRDVVKTEEKPILKFIEDIKKASISKSLLTKYLLEEDLIDFSQIKPQKQDKVILCEIPITTETGRNSTFKIWEGRRPWEEKTNKNALENWKKIKIKGKDEFVKHLKPQGKEYFETEQGQKWLETAFKI